jgi:hypothetical protein
VCMAATACNRVQDLRVLILNLSAVLSGLCGRLEQTHTICPAGENLVPNPIQ